MKPERLDLRPERLDLRSARPDLRPERLDLRPDRLDLRPERHEKLWKGGTYGGTDVWKFTPVSYRTSALWGRCPKSGRKTDGYRGRQTVKQTDR